ncbi:MAG: AAA family ATPase [Tannerella sp.]|jgi:AAA15 family ATPase/GTPase|nr:AAA family ATPase [Tannerella sp.]
MKISKIHLTNFKRFADLLIDNIPSASKLVLLIGANGSGKSSLFDAFGFMDTAIKDNYGRDDEFRNYYKKQKDSPASVAISFDNHSEITVNSDNYHILYPKKLSATTFYGRTSFRQIPRLTRTSLGKGEQVDFQKDSDRPRFFIERDNRFENDVEKITEVIVKEIFRLQQSGEQIRQKYIYPINSALENIFGSGNGTKLQLIEIIPPLEGKVAQITFRKGDSEFHYNYLSAGEKEVFNLLINFLSRGSFFQDTIYAFDEIDLHLNTKLQFNLLKEITENWIPENCQLWTASHSLGFIEYAKQSDIASIIDFDDLDFDIPRVLTPVPKDNPEIYEIAVGKEFLASLFRQMSIYFVENKDKEYYATVGIANTVFVSENDRNSVYHKVKATNNKGIVDRDFLSDDDIVQIRKHYPNLTLLDYYSIENYLYHPDNLSEYYNSKNKAFDREEYITQLTEAKNKAKDTFIPALTSRRTGYPYFGEPDQNERTALQNRFKNRGENEAQSAIVAAYLNSNDFDVYYKSLPMKSYCTELPQRQNIPKSDLAKTQWFKAKIENLT